MLTSNLGDLEKKVMDILWECKKCSTRNVLIKIGRDKKFAYTTIATILQRLFDKGLLSRKENASGYIYSPKVSKENFTKNVAQSFLNKFIDSYGDTAISSFADSIDMLPEEKRKQFIRIIEDYEKNK